jgi:hypothetical protein
LTDPVAAAEEQPAEAVSEEEMLLRLQQEFSARRAAQAPRSVSVMDLYHQFVSLVAGSLGYRDAKIKSETNAIKLMEITLFWALNNRNQQNQSEVIPQSEISGESGEEGEEEELPTPDEVIEASLDQTDPTED